jgi:hypothetical protein
MPRTVFAVLRREVGRLMIVGLGNAGVGKAYFGVSDQFDGFYLPATMATDNKVPVRPRAWNILSAVYDGVNQEGYVNGDLQCTTPFQLNTTDAPAELGARTVQSGAQWRAAGSDGDFAEMLVYKRALDRFEREAARVLSGKDYRTPAYCGRATHEGARSLFELRSVE